MQKLDNTESLCPTCFCDGILNKIDADIIEDEGKIWMKKNCPKHGSFKEIISDDVNLYKRWMRYKAKGKPVPYIKTDFFPSSVLYTEHLSQPMLLNLMVTNRYNFPSDQNFLDANINGYVYEPSLEQIKDLIKQTRSQKPLELKALQIMGGEPTLRDDLLEIISIAKESGFTHIQLQTNGLRLAESIDYCQSLKNAKVDTIYLNFNGVTKTTNPFLESHKKVIENCKKINLNIVLVSILTDHENVEEIGKIVRFAIDNRESIKGVHFQIYGQNYLTSKTTTDKEEKKHFGYGEILQSIEQEFPGYLSRDDFYPYSFTFPISKFVQIITNEPQTDATAHPYCGGTTFVFIENGQPLPLTRFIDVEGFMNFLTNQSKKKGPLRKLRIASAFMKYIDTFVDFNKAPNGFNPKQILKDATVFGSDYALREFRNKTIFIGFMKFQDIKHLDIDRLKHCVIHYTTFDGIIPFCSYHTLGYGDTILKKYSIPVHEWESKTGRSIKDNYKSHE
jgi:tetraether lipid synthase